MKWIIAIIAACLVSASLMGQNKLPVSVGVDASMDCFLPNINPSVGIGVLARLGNPNQWINVVGGLRYIYGPRLSGFQVPIMLNVNLLKGKLLSGYLGGGYELDFLGTYWGCTKFQVGIAGRHIDFRIFYKPYQEDLGAGFTYYF